MESGLTVLSAVLVINGLLMVGCWWLVSQMWQWRRHLRQAAAALQTAEQHVYNTLRNAPQVIMIGQAGVHQGRLQYQRLEPQLRKLRRVLSLLNLVLKLGRVNTPPRSPFRPWSIGNIWK